MIDFKQQVKSIYGEPFKTGENENATLGKFCVEALLANFPDEQNLSGEEKLKRWLLASKIYSAAGELSVEELTLLKKLAGKAYSSALVGPIYCLLDPSVTR